MACFAPRMKTLCVKRVSSYPVPLFCGPIGTDYERPDRHGRGAKSLVHATASTAVIHDSFASQAMPLRRSGSDGLNLRILRGCSPHLGPHSSPPVDSFDQLDRTPAPATSKSRTGRSPLRSLRLVADIHATSIRSSSVRSSKPKPVAFATQSAAVLLWLRPGQVKMPFGAKHVTVEVRNPLPPIGRDI